MAKKKDCLPDAYLLPVATKDRNGLIKVNGYLLNYCIKMNITASSEEWEKLYQEHVGGKNSDALLKVLRRFIQAADNFQFKKELTTRHKNTHHFVHLLKIQAGLIYRMLKHWRKQAAEKRPAVLNTLLQRYKEEYFITKSNFRVNDLTEACIKTLYGQQMKKYGIRAFDDPTNFYNTYIHDGMAMLRRPFDPRHDVIETLQMTMALLIAMKREKTIPDMPTFDFVRTLISAFLLDRAARKRASEDIVSLRQDLEAVFPFLRPAPSVKNITSSQTEP